MKKNKKVLDKSQKQTYNKHHQKTYGILAVSSDGSSHFTIKNRTGLTEFAVYLCIFLRQVQKKAGEDKQMFLYAVWPVIVAGVAVIMDIRSARVDNGWIVFSLCVSLYLTIWREGIWAVPIFFVGSLMPLVILGILF